MEQYGIVRPLVKEDYEALSRFLEKETKGIFQKDFWLDRFDYWWCNNPAMRPDIQHGWILSTKNGQIVGFFGNIPVRYLINRRETIVCSATSWYVAEEFRHQSLELLSPFLKQRNPLLDTTPTEKIVDILHTLKFHSLQQNWLSKDAVCPVDAREFCNFLIARTTSKKSRTMLLKMAALLAVPAIKVLQTVNKLRLPPIKGGYTVSEVGNFDDSYTLLWNKLKNKYDILAIRNQEALSWFFFGSPDLRSNRKVLEIREKGTLVGYIAVKLVVSKAYKKEIYRYFEVADMVIIEDNPMAYCAALKGLLLLARKNKDKISFIKISPFDRKIEEHLTKFGFFGYKGKARFLYRGFGENGSDRKDSLESGFYATPLDGDRCYFP